MVMRPKNLKKNNSKGQELVEFAITLPLLALLIFGIFDLGRLVYYYSAMQNSAREGARFGVVNPWQEGAVINRTKERTLGIDPSDLNVVVSYDCERVKVSVFYSYDPWIPLLNNVPISTSSELQRERWLAGIDEPDETCTPGVD
jgi:hypothetical protein